MNADDVVSIAPPSEQLRLQIGWDKRMGITSNPVRYNKTAALLLYWCEDDSDLATENEVSGTTTYPRCVPLLIHLCRSSICAKSSKRNTISKYIRQL